MQKLQSLRQSSDQDRTKLEKRFKDRLKEMDVKMKELHRKEKQFCQLERLKARSEETCARLNSDILSIKQQKVGWKAFVKHMSAQVHCKVTPTMHQETLASCSGIRVAPSVARCLAIMCHALLLIACILTLSHENRHACCSQQVTRRVFFC